MRIVHTTYIQFQNKIRNEQLPLFRGAIISRFKNNILFHNHLNDKLVYSYPLIQYKRINGYAGIVGINEGAEALKELSATDYFYCQIGEQLCEMKIQSVTSSPFTIDITNSPIKYKIYGWLPLNQENYQKYQMKEILSERVVMLEKILIGNILSFAKGVQIYIDSNIVCRLTSIESQRPIFYKGVEMMSFNATFQCNVLLPNNIGIGKGASINHGVIFAS